MIMKRKRLADTALAVYLSLNIEVIDGQQRSGVYAMPLVSLTWLLVAVWLLRVEIARLGHELQAIVQPWTGMMPSQLTAWRRRLQAITNQWQVALVVAGIGWRSVAWGVGI
jgi:hypothetical protein